MERAVSAVVTRTSSGEDRVVDMPPTLRLARVVVDRFVLDMAL